MKKILFLLPLLMLGAFAFAVTVTPTPTPYPTEVWPRDPHGRQAAFFAGGTNRFPLKVQQVSRGSEVVPPSYDQMASISASAAIAANGATRTAAAQEAAPAMTASDPGFVRLSATAHSFISITITSTVNGTQNHQILAAAGAGLRYRIINYGMGISGACTGGNTTALISLCSNGVTLPGTTYVPMLPTSVVTGPGGFTVPEVDKSRTFLVGGYNEALCWKWITTSAMAGTNCIARLNVEYEIIP